MQFSESKQNLVLRIKWSLICIISLYLLIGYPLGVFPAKAAFPVFMALLIASSTALLLVYSRRRNIFPFFFTHLSLTLDLLIIIFGVYFSGGTENTWLFMPVFVIYLAGYLFDLRTSLAYAMLAFGVVAAMFFLEYFDYIPHFSLYNLPDFYWRNPGRYIGFLVGMFVLYFVGALSSGYLNQIVNQTLISLGNSLTESKGRQKEAEDSHKAMLNLMEDLGSAKEGLELRVKERTAELEEAKATLEKRVSERTVALDNSRKAILHMMKDLKEDMTKLQTIDRMKTEFLSMVSHELRTPITPLKGYLKLLLAGKIGKLAPNQIDTLHVLEHQGEHLEDLIDSLLDISRLELGKPIPTKKEPLSIKNVITDVAEAMVISAENRGLKLEQDLPDTLPAIFGDEIKIKRVLSNLIGNALKFTPKGGKIQVRATTQDASVRIEVLDNGIGLSKVNLEKIFEKFYQVDSSFTRAAGGIGMGLSIAKELVELHGGKIWAESKGLGNGSKFIFILPTAQTKEF